MTIKKGAYPPLKNYTYSLRLLGANVKFFFTFFSFFLQAAFSSVVGWFGMFVAGAEGLSIGERVVGGWSGSVRHKQHLPI